MLNIIYVDVAPSGLSNGITTYTTQYLSAIQNFDSLNVSCVFLNANIDKLTSSQSDKIKYYYIPSFNSVDIQNMSSDEWCANILFDIIGNNKPIIHLNWFSHINIFKRLRYRTIFSLIFIKHCIPWRDLITDDYNKFKAIDARYKTGQQISTLDLPLNTELSSYEVVDHIVTVTEMAKDNLVVLFGQIKEKISVIYNGLDYSETFKSKSVAKVNLRKQYGFDKKDQILLYVGTISKRKGVCDLIEAFNHLYENLKFSSFKLVIAGGGDFSLLFKYPKAAKNIVILDNVSKDKLWDFYKMSNIGIIPSYVEQCSYSAIEMMLSHLPILVSNVDGLKEIVKSEFGTHVNLQTPIFGKPFIAEYEIEDQILKILEDETLTASKADLAYDNALIQFSLGQMITKLKRTYELVTSLQNDSNVNIASNAPLVSVILPVRNGEKYISDCIKSILSQTYRHFELLIIDDASTDQTNNIIHEFSDDRIIVIENLEKQGIAKSLNLGLQRCKGKYCARIDGDDLMIENRLDEQVHFLEKSPDYAVIGSWYETINSSGRLLSTITPATGNDDLKFLMLFSNNIAHPTTMIRMSILKSIGYKSSYRHCEDYTLWLHLCQRYKIGNLPLILTKYRIHSKNVSIKFARCQKRNSIKLLSNFLFKTIPNLDPEEIIIHGAIMLKLGSAFFTKESNLIKLTLWIDKLLIAFRNPNNIDNLKEEELKRHIISLCCR